MAVSHKSFEIHSMGLGDERWALIERVASSRHLKSSVRLREFLFYTADCAIRQAPEDATEQQIGIRVFHRHPGYNSSEDSIVRTHARLLRQKLAAYFAEEGAGEELVVEIPKGHYLPIFVSRKQEIEVLEHVSVNGKLAKAATPEITQSSRKFWSRKWLLLLLPIVIIAAVLLSQMGMKPGWTTSPVDKFWKPFFTDDPPLVIFSNAMFVGDSRTGLRYASPPEQAADTPNSGDYVDTYTGIGELVSVYTLTRLFDSHHAHFVLKRSLLTTWDEARNRNLVFIGSVAENVSLRVLQSMTDFTMTTGPGYSGLVNHHPKTGEPLLYSRPEHPLIKDYAVLALLPGVQPGKKMLIFSGLTTFGTQGAVDYVCHPDTVAELLRQITGPKGEIRPFEAVLETEIGGGVPLRTRLVTIRVH